MEDKAKTRGWGGLFTLMDRFSGDKVIMLIALFLMLISVISVFSSTPLLARQMDTSRMSIMVEQLKAVAVGFALMLALYWFGRVEWYRRLSMYGFGISFVILVILVFHLNLGVVKAASVNGAWRILKVMGKQVHVYEFVKVFMVMYLGWAMDTYKNGGFKWAPRLAQRYEKLAFLGSDKWLKMLYIYFPILTSIFMVAPGSNSAALFMGVVMGLMVLVGGLDLKDVFIGIAVVGVVAGGMLGLYKTGLLQDTRIGTAIARIMQDDEATMKILLSSPRNSNEWNAARDELQQTVGARLAIQEGGIGGKGIGNSTQKYAVPVIFGDYMFSFIIEETGLLGAIVIMLLYFSLLARGSMVAKECDKYYDKMIMTGLTILITGQAFMHMAVNVHLPLVPQTGQTLPLVSHGTNALLVFSIVFGILLSISKDARENMARREAMAPPIIEHSTEWTQNTTE